MRGIPRLLGVSLIGLIALSSAALVGDVWREPDWSRIPVTTLADFESLLAQLRERLEIPGMAAVIAEGDRIIWQCGFGFVDLATKKPVSPDSVFHLASLTKPYSATLVLQLADEGRLDVDAPVSSFGISTANNAAIRVRHLLSHTSSGQPGTTFKYDGTAFGRLTTVIERVTGESFASALTRRIIGPLHLANTAPNPQVLRVGTQDDGSAEAFADSGLDRQAFQARLTTGYARAWGQSVWKAGLIGPPRPQSHATTLFASGGLVATPSDVARFSVALDTGRLLKPSTIRAAYSGAVTPNGTVLPYGLGWFVQSVRGSSIVWHFGQGYESSSLIVKIPGRQMVFVILANADGLSRRRRLGDYADLLRSPPAVLFLNWVFSGARVDEMHQPVVPRWRA